MEANYDPNSPAGRIAEHTGNADYLEPRHVDWRERVWHSPTTSEVRWEGHLEVSRPKYRGKRPAAYRLKMRVGVSPVLVHRQMLDGDYTGTWTVVYHGTELPMDGATKADAQRTAESLLGVGWRYDIDKRNESRTAERWTAAQRRTP